MLPTPLEVTQVDARYKAGFPYQVSLIREDWPCTDCMTSNQCPIMFDVGGI